MFTRNRTIERTEILGTEVRGEGAKVRYKLYNKSGQTPLSSDELVKEEGDWKINH